jgi:Ion transport protein
MPRMFAIWLLLCLVSYIFAVMFTQLFKDLYEQGATGDVDYFGRMDKTFFTLFQIMTLDAWSDIARDVMAVYPWAWLPIIAYVIITGFVVVNLVIAVICDAVAALHDDDKAKLHGQAVPLHDASEGNDHDGIPHSRSRGSPAVALPPPTIRDQLTALENHVDELSQQQEDTLQAVLAITQHLAQAKQQRGNRAAVTTQVPMS